MKSPVLFLVFNRPETTRQVFESIRWAQPSKLYIAVDGPRVGRAEEAQRCNEVRAIASAVDWPCEVNTLFRDHNLGCKSGVSSAVTWFFDHEEEGIILEDDILPIPTFFSYCEELLERYRDDARVAMISGCNLVSDVFKPDTSYFFSRYNFIWGWASWRRVWKHYDVTMAQWPDWRDAGGLANMPGSSYGFEKYWRRIMDATHKGEIDTWDYQWLFTCWRLKGLTALPLYNQTDNLGFGADATHTTNAAPDYILSSRARRLDFPLTHPSTVEHSLEGDSLISSRVMGISAFSEIKKRIKSLPIIGSAITHIGKYARKSGS